MKNHASRDVEARVPGVESIILTDELDRRPSRPADYESENRALVELARQMVSAPQSIVQKLAETALRLCDADSAGISLLDEDGQNFTWVTIVGQWASHLGGGTPRDFGPCGMVLDRDDVMLFSHPQRYFTYMQPAMPYMEELLLAPFHIAGKPAATVWIVSHDQARRQFDCEDRRLLTSLSAFASVAYQSARDSEHRYRALVEALPMALYTTDAKGRVTLFNQAAADFVGRAPQVGVDEWCVSWKMYRPDNGERLPHAECPMAMALKEDRCVRGEEIVIERPDGSRVSCMPYPTPLHDASGKMIGAVNMVVDITESKEARMAAARLAAIVKSTDDAIVGKTLNGVITSWNQSAQRIFGYTAEEAVGQNITFVMPPDRRDEEQVILAKLRQGESLNHIETKRITKDGRLIDISATISPVRDERGRIIGASKIARDITERKLAEEATREANHNKDVFLGTLAHELRNPLAPISHALAVMSANGHNPAKAKRLCEVMSRQVKQITRLIDDLMDVSRVSRGKLELKTQQMDLSDAVAAALEAAQPWLNDPNAKEWRKLTIEQADEPLVLNADAARLAQVLSNLLNNAFKYAGASPGRPGHVRLITQRDGDEAAVRVQDNGIGIPADKLGSIFEIFTQLDHAPLLGGKGLGVGLTLVKQFVEMHGGRIEARSGGVGQGSEFVVHLPLCADPVLSVNGQNRGWGDTSGIKSPAREYRVVLVEDHPAVAEMFAMLLEQMGCQVRIAVNGREALEAAAEEKPDVVFSDISMPHMSGYDLARQLRELPGWDEVLLVAVSGYGQPEDRRKALEAGFDEHLVKPPEPERLQAVFDSVGAAARGGGVCVDP